jgi:hypothetical protein
VLGVTNAGVGGGAGSSIVSATTTSAVGGPVGGQGGQSHGAGFSTGKYMLLGNFLNQILVKTK